MSTTTAPTPSPRTGRSNTSLHLVTLNNLGVGLGPCARSYICSQHFGEANVARPTFVTVPRNGDSVISSKEELRAVQLDGKLTSCKPGDCIDFARGFKRNPVVWYVFSHEPWQKDGVIACRLALGERDGEMRLLAFSANPAYYADSKGPLQIHFVFRL